MPRLLIKESIIGDLLIVSGESMTIIVGTMVTGRLASLALKNK